MDIIYDDKISIALLVITYHYTNWTTEYNTIFYILRFKLHQTIFYIYIIRIYKIVITLKAM